MKDGGDTSIDVEVWHGQKIGVQGHDAVYTVVAHRGQMIGVSG
jgi:hypothetical protein